MVRLVVIIAAVVLVVSLVRGFVRASPAVVARSIKITAAALAGIGLLWLMASGRLGWLVPALAGLAAVTVRALPVIARLAPALHRLWVLKKTGAGARPNRSSVVEARFVRMRLDHETGEIVGQVLEGVFAGRELAEMTMAEVVDLFRTCQREDEESAALVKAYLDRIYGEEWTSSSSNERTGDSSQSMTLEEARQILGVAPDASKQDVIEAHRRLMQRLHPDRGGSDYLAAQINQAKALLLGR